MRLIVKTHLNEYVTLLIIVIIFNLTTAIGNPDIKNDLSSWSLDT